MSGELGSDPTLQGRQGHLGVGPGDAGLLDHLEGVGRARIDVQLGGDACGDQAAGIGDVLKEHGEKSISTEAALDYIADTLPVISNAAEKSMLRHFATEMQTAGEAGTEPERRVVLQKLDSVRKDIASALQTKQIAIEGAQPTSVTAEMAHHLRALYKRVMGEIGEQAPELSAALDRYRKFSRPLDDFERKGGLKDVVARDSFGDDFVMGEADVVTRVLNKAAGGHPVLARLVPANRMVAVPVAEMTCAGPALPALIHRLSRERARASKGALP